MNGLIFEQAPVAAKCNLNELRELNRWAVDLAILIGNLAVVCVSRPSASENSYGSDKPKRTFQHFHNTAPRRMEMKMDDRAKQAHRKNAF